MLRRSLASLLTACILLLSLSACAPKTPAAAGDGDAAFIELAPLTPAPATPAPGSAQSGGGTGLYCEMQEKRLYYPEGSAEADAEYILSYTFPRFAGAHAENANAAMELWEKELLERVSRERLPYADRAEGEEAPSTVVSLRVEAAGGYTNVHISEQAHFGAETELRQSAIVLDAAGEETNLCAVSGLYSPEALLAQQAYNYIDAEDPARSRYYGDLTPGDVELLLDLYNGFYMREDGYTLLFQPGMLADASQGVVEIEAPFTSLYPDFVGPGEAVTAEEYARLLPALGLLARACAAESRSFEGAPDPLAATLFMGLVLREEYPADKGFLRVEKAEYEARFRSYFGKEPVSLEGGDGTALEDGFYLVPLVDVADYGLRLDGCTAQGHTLTLRGVLHFGVPGGAGWGELSPVGIELERDADAAAGFLFRGFTYA